jgi:Carboxypeptidase regulatory-like domain
MHPFLPAFWSGRSRYVRVDELARARIIVLQCTIATLAAALLAAPTVSCGKSPTASSPVEDQSQPILQSIRIDGPFGLAPGGTAQYTVIGQFSNGPTRDVTGTSTWRSSDGEVLSIAPNGGATAGKPGQVVLAAENSNRRASIDVLVLIPGTFRLTGTVRDAGTPIADATVDLLDGSRTVMPTRTDGTGVYRLFGVAGTVEVRASKPGYLATVNRLTVDDNASSDFVLAPDPQVPDVRGTYTLTLSASDACKTSSYLALPAEATTRKYTATVRQIGASLQVDLSDAALLKRSFAGEVHGPRATFELRGIDPPFYYYFEHIETETDVLEQVSPRDVFEAVGHVEGTLSQAVISGTLKGILALVSNLPFRTLDAYCPGDHSFVMVRR